MDKIFLMASSLTSNSSEWIIDIMIFSGSSAKALYFKLFKTEFWIAIDCCFVLWIILKIYSCWLKKLLSVLISNQLTAYTWMINWTSVFEDRHLWSINTLAILLDSMGPIFQAAYLGLTFPCEMPTAYSKRSLFFHLNYLFLLLSDNDGLEGH